MGRGSAIYLSLAPTDAKPGPRAPARDTTKKADSTKKDDKAKPPAKKPDAKPAKDSTPVDLTIEVVDAAGHSARLPLTKFGVPRRPLEVHILRRQDEEKQRYPDAVRAGAADLRDAARRFRRRRHQASIPAHLRSIRLVFDRLVAGTVVVDDIGISGTAGRLQERAVRVAAETPGSRRIDGGCWPIVRFFGIRVRQFVWTACAKNF